MNQRRWAFVLYYLGAAVVIAYLFRGDLPNSYRFVREGVQVQGVVTKTSCKTSPAVSYQFTVNGTPFDGSGEGGNGNLPCEALKAGDPVTICYLPSRPESSIPGNPHERFWTGMAGIAMAALFIPLVLLFAFFVILRKSSRKTREDV